MRQSEQVSGLWPQGCIYAALPYAVKDQRLSWGGAKAYPELGLQSLLLRLALFAFISSLVSFLLL